MISLAKGDIAIGREQWNVLVDWLYELWLEKNRNQPMWQPIETAPRDGTIIDVWLGNVSKSDAAFYCTPGTRRSPGWSWRVDRFRPMGGLPGMEMMTTFVEPTHWMPLPDAPTYDQSSTDPHHGGKVWTR